MYERNTLFCQGLYGVLQPLEIIFRNSVHRSISIGVGKSNWYDFSLLRTREYESVKEAKANIVDSVRPVVGGEGAVRVNILRDLLHGRSIVCYFSS
jgi:hypothetical protein